jgi:hypothetical protein
MDYPVTWILLQDWQIQCYTRSIPTGAIASAITIESYELMNLHLRYLGPDNPQVKVHFLSSKGKQHSGASVAFFIVYLPSYFHYIAEIFKLVVSGDFAAIALYDEVELPVAWVWD